MTNTENPRDKDPHRLEEPVLVLQLTEPRTRLPLHALAVNYV